MSWLSNLTSKAEAMLVRLDQDAAQALQNPDQILKPVVRIFDGQRDDNANPSTSRQDQGQLTPNRLVNEPSVVVDDTVSASLDESCKMETVADSQVIEHATNNDDTGDVASGMVDAKPSSIDGPYSIEEESGHSVEADKLTGHLGDSTANDPTSTNKHSQASRFKLQTCKLRQPLRDPSNRARRIPLNGAQTDSRANNLIESPGVDDIRASINRSLQEYSQTSSTAHNQTAYTSHFDNQPNLISHSPSSESDLGDRTTFGRLHSSPSFSIDFPYDDVGSPNRDRQTASIANHILQERVFSKQSTFNLHKVINKLSSQRVQSHQLISDKHKIRLRRAQMRMASQFRRLNYYFRTHPSIKYWMVGYLVLLQILVIYVLFFYQSSGSSNYLASQVAQQQEELAESLKSDSEKTLAHA